MKDIFKSACRAINAGFLIFDAQGAILFINEQAKELSCIKCAGTDEKAGALFDWLKEKGIFKSDTPVFDIFIVPQEERTIIVHASPMKEGASITGIVGRMKALIDIADPKFRDDLARKAYEIYHVLL